MIPDPTAEIRRIRHQLGADDGYNLDRIFARAQRLQEEIGKTCVRRPRRKPADNQSMHRSGTSDGLAVENLSSPPDGHSIH